MSATLDELHSASVNRHPSSPYTLHCLRPPNGEGWGKKNALLVTWNWRGGSSIICRDKCLRESEAEGIYMSRAFEGRPGSHIRATHIAKRAKAIHLSIARYVGRKGRGRRSQSRWSRTVEGKGGTTIVKGEPETRPVGAWPCLAATEAMAVDAQPKEQGRDSARRKSGSAEAEGRLNQAGQAFSSPGNRPMARSGKRPRRSPEETPESVTEAHKWPGESIMEEPFSANPLNFSKTF
ncbi:hypothetical protein VNO77_03615 [Canavalia gladiata]|uniref:Uncharacterized protein n=1 Tax=Canavalia gladiata TaxID=3824 RepID=A0AAN9MVU8_CANGL